jgi:hypothetical protein
MLSFDLFAEGCEFLWLLEKEPWASDIFELDCQLVDWRLLMSLGVIL